MDAGEQVDEEIAGDGRAVIPVIPPAEEPDRVERPLRAPRPGSGPSRSSRARRRSESSIARRRSSELRLYRASMACTLPIEPGLDQLLDLVVEDRAGVLAADLEDGLGLLLGGDDVRPFVDAADHRLLAVDGLAGLHGVDRHPGVPVVGNADQDRVDVLAGEDLAIVDIGLDLVAEDFLGMGAPAFVQVGGGDQLDAGDLEGTRRCR